jgi:hypothetical protein
MASTTPQTWAAASRARERTTLRWHLCQRHGIWGGLTEQERNAAATEQPRGTGAAPQLSSLR